MNEITISDDVLVDSKRTQSTGLIVILESGSTLRKTTNQITSINGIDQKTKSVFLLTKKIQSYSGLLEQFEKILFVKTREIPRLRNDYDNSVFILLSYRIKNPTHQQKKKIERLARRSASIRLRPGVLLFPHLRAKDHRKFFDSGDKEMLMDSKKLSTVLEEMGANTTRYGHLKPHSELDGTRILAATQEMLSKDLSSLENRVHELREMVHDTLISKKQLKIRFTSLHSRYRELKTKWIKFRIFWGIDATKDMKKIYNLLLITRRSIKDRS